MKLFSPGMHDSIPSYHQMSIHMDFHRSIVVETWCHWIWVFQVELVWPFGFGSPLHTRHGFAIRVVDEFVLCIDQSENIIVRPWCRNRLPNIRNYLRMVWWSAKAKLCSNIRNYLRCACKLCSNIRNYLRCAWVMVNYSKILFANYVLHAHGVMVNYSKILL